MHEHDWTPVPLERGQYLCACGASGFRVGGVIRAHRIPLFGRRDVTVSAAGDGNRWVEPAPTLDDYDRGDA
jgi:hypothetical protein